MSSTNTMNSGSHAIEQTVADLKQGVETMTTAQTAASQKAMKAAQDVAAFSQGSLQAFTEASQAYAAGSQDLFRQMFAASQSAYAEVFNNVRAIMGAKTAKERLELQANFARTSAVRAVSEASRFAQAGIELTEKASAPLLARATVAAETFGRI